ncbi:MAG: hypothetical protein PUC36_05190 [Clostridiales bacterium]|nr:hypothetical protein [Clostridiales bacterium]
MARCDSRTTYRSAQQAHAKVLSAQRSLEAETEEPMRRYVFPIEPPAPAARGTGEAEDSGAAMGKILEQLQCQNQLLVDLLGAVNSLTAALLCHKPS